MIRLALMIVMSVASLGCGQYSATKPKGAETNLISAVATPAELESKAMSLLQTKCSGCHSATLVNGGLGAVTSKVHLLAQGFVVPGGAVNSVLFDAIASNRMPLGSALSDTDKSSLRAWIIDAIPNLPVGPVSFNPTRLIIQAKCVSCHGVTGGNLGGINLESYANVRARVTPGAPEQSALFDAVLKERMPKVGAKLTLKELATVYGWIYAGASEAGGE